LPDVFIEQVRDLKVGELAPAVLHTGAGFHVLQLIEKRNATSVPMGQTRARHILLRPSKELSRDAALRQLAEFKKQIQSAYNDRIRVVARAFYQSHKILFATPEEFEAFKKKYEVVQKKYQERLRTGKTNVSGFEKPPLEFEVIKSGYLKGLKNKSVPSDDLGNQLQEDFRSLADYLATQNENASKNAFTREEKENYWYLANVSAGFWVRRSIDGTEKQFFDILTRLLEIYDAEWLNEQKLLDTQPSQ
jgi:hypothetical protein